MFGQVYSNYAVSKMMTLNCNRTKSSAMVFTWETIPPHDEYKTVRHL